MTKPYYSDDAVTIYHGDLRDILSEISEVDCIVADPTYNQTSLTWDRWVDGWPAVARGCLSERGSMWCFGTLRMFLDRRDDFEAWHLSQDVVWEKHNGSGFQNDRFKRVHEQAALFYPKGVAWEDVYKAPVFTNDATRRTVRRKQRPPHMGHIEAVSYASEDGGPRLMRSVMYVRSTHGHATNPTQKPEGIVRPLVEYSCPPDGLLLSPFMGSGTDLVVAKELGVRAIGIDVRESECEEAANRVSQMLPFHVLV